MQPSECLVEILVVPGTKSFLFRYKFDGTILTLKNTCSPNSYQHIDYLYFRNLLMPRQHILLVRIQELFWYQKPNNSKF